MVNKVRVLAGIVCIASVLVWLVGGQISAGSTTPGTVDDPLVTKSYVDLKVSALKTEVLALMDALGSVQTDSMDEDETVDTSLSNDQGVSMEDVKAYVNAQLMANDSAGSGASASADNQLFEVVKANTGQRLICGASTEVILRAGNASVIAGVNGDGLADLTSGEDLSGGSDVPRQHHLLVARDDGRGLLITTDDPEGATYTYILVKGDYRLE